MKNAAKEEKFETALKYRDLIQGMQHVQKGLREYRTWIGQDLIYSEQVADGRKYFFIHEGLAIYKEIMLENVDSVDEEVFLEKFRKEAEVRVNQLCERELDEKKKLMEKEGLMGKEGLTEKEKIDYQDIVYSELFKKAPVELQ